MLLMPANTAQAFSYCTSPFQGFAGQVCPCCPKCPAGTSRVEMFVLGRVRTSLRGKGWFVWLLNCMTCFSLAYRSSNAFCRGKHDIKIEWRKK